MPRVRLHQTLIVVVLLSAFLIRFWGLEFEGRGKGPYNNDAGPLYLRYVKYFQGGGLNPRLRNPTTHDTCYPFFAQYLMAVACWTYTGMRYAAAAISYLTTIQPFSFDGGITLAERLLVCRLLQISLATALVYLIYRMGLVFRGRRVALIGAFIAAFSPALIAHARELQSDITVTFFTSLCVYFSGLIILRGRIVWYLLAGLMAGLAVGSKHNGAVVILAVIAAHLFRWWEASRGRAEGCSHGRIFAALAVFLIGIGISYPIIWLEPRILFKALPHFYNSQLVSDKPDTVTGTFWHHRWINLWRFTADTSGLKNGVGIPVFILGLAGLLRALFTRKRPERFLAFFPLAYLVFVLLFRGNVRHKDFLPTVVFLPLFAAWFLVGLADRLRARAGLTNALLAFAAILVSAPAMLSDVQTAYCFWQRDTREWCTEWIGENIPPGSRIVRERTPPLPEGIYDAPSCRRSLRRVPLSAYQDDSVDYLIANSLTYGRFFVPYDTYYNEGAQQFYRELAEGFAVKTFRIENNGFVDPEIQVYNLHRPLPGWEDKTLLLRDLDSDYSVAAPEFQTLEKDLEHEGPNGFTVGGENPVGKMLIAPAKLATVGFLILPTAAGSTISIRAGGKKQVIDCDTLAPCLQLLEPRVGFPFLKYSYPVRAESVSGHPFLVRILTSSRQIDRELRRRGDPRSRPPDPVARARLAAVLEEIRGSEDFDRAFERAFAESASWRRKKHTRVYECELSPRHTGEVAADPAASGASAVAFRPPAHAPGALAYGPFVQLPPGPYRVDFRMRFEGEGAAGPIAVCDVFDGRRVLARRELRADEVPGSNGYRAITLSFSNDCFANSLEFRVLAVGDVPFVCDRVEVYPDLAAWFKEYE